MQQRCYTSHKRQCDCLQVETFLDVRGTTQLVTAGKWPQDTGVVKLWLGDSGRTFPRDLAHRGDWYHAGSQWKATGLRTRLKEKLCPRKQVEFYFLQFFTSPFVVYAVLRSIFLAFSFETEEHLKPHWKSCKATLGKSCIWASLCFKLFVGLVAYIGPGFNFLGSSSFLGSGSWKRMCGGEYLHQACSSLWTFQGWSLILFLVRCECPKSLVPLLLSGQFPRNGNVIPAAGPKHASSLSG